MTAADLPARLRAMAGPIEPNVCTEAADEIERLRKELVSNTDELRSEIERLRKERDEERAFQEWYQPIVDSAEQASREMRQEDRKQWANIRRLIFQLAIMAGGEDPDVLHAQIRCLLKERDEARREIERLRAGGCARDQRTTQYCAEVGQWVEKCKVLEAERDAARREICKTVVFPSSPGIYAAQRGWDCYRDVKP